VIRLRLATLGVPRGTAFPSGSHSPTIDTWTVVRDSGLGISNDGCALIWADETGAMSVHTAEADGISSTFFVTFGKSARFRLSFAAREIAMSIAPGTHDSTIDHLLVDQIWPRIIAHVGHLVIHASGVSTDRGAILIVGPSGRGKSTLAASLHQRGFPLLGDDAIIVGGDGCRAVYPSLRLFADSIDTLFTAPTKQSPVAHYSAKRNIHLPADASSPDQNQHSRGIFFLEPDAGVGDPAVIRMAPAAACMTLVEHSFWLDPTSIEQSAQRMQAASAIAGSAPLFRLNYTRDYSALDDLHDAIFAALE
jgi:hypothetical protein